MGKFSAHTKKKYWKANEMEATKNNTFILRIHTYTLSDGEVNSVRASSWPSTTDFASIVSLYSQHRAYNQEQWENKFATKKTYYFYYTFVSMSSRIFVHIEIEWIRYLLLFKKYFFRLAWYEFHTFVINTHTQPFVNPQTANDIRTGIIALTK